MNLLVSHRACREVISFSFWDRVPLSSAVIRPRSDSCSWASADSFSIRLFHFSCSKRPCSSRFSRSATRAAEMDKAHFYGGEK